MPCTLHVRDDLSVSDVTKLSRLHNVRVTPHVGNWTPARLFLPSLGADIVCIDHTIGERDKNANPHLLIQGGNAQMLCSHPDRMTTHASVTELAYREHTIGKPLSEVHVGTLRTLFPEASIRTHTEHLIANTETTLTVLEEVTKFSVGSAWWRRVSSDGEVTNYRKNELPRTWDEIATDIFPLTNQGGGWLIHNRVAILMDVLEQSCWGEMPAVYHLSGPDMVRYLGGEMKTLSRLYDHVRARLGLRQETVAINLVPFASFRFATSVSQAAACERLCSLLQSDAVSDEQLRDCVVGAPDIFAKSEDQNHFSQHDAAALAEPVVAPGEAYEWPMARCGEFMERLWRLA